jgi:hypothetical protein
MARERKNKDCITATIKFCGEDMAIIHARQAKALTESGVKISIETAVNKLLLGK